MRSRLHYCQFHALKLLGVSCGSDIVSSNRDMPTQERKRGRSRPLSCLSVNWHRWTWNSASLNYIFSFLVPSIALLEAASSSINEDFGFTDEPLSVSSTVSNLRSPKAAVTYDFVIVGYGTAGQSALQTLKRQCPTARIALIDPLRSPGRRHDHYYKSRVFSISPDQQTVELEDEQTISYKHAILIATGSHGAPPPSYLMDILSQDRIYELRSTILPSSVRSRPVLSPELVRKRVLYKVVHENARVAVLGSGWEAVDLAVRIALTKKQRPTLVLGNQSPLCHVLPNYLSTAVSKRLQARRINILNRSLVRYISHNSSTDALDLFTTKSYDFLDGTTASADLVVAAPDSSGSLGSAVLPTDDVPDFLLDTVEGRSWYQTWSDLDTSNPTKISCYQDDGRIAVNNELLACSRVYAAGSVAKYANRLTGHATCSGSGYHESTQSGYVAGMNMSGHFLRASLFQSSEARSITKEPSLLWRSDRLSCGTQSLLAEVGIHALCVGNCDSERHSTHAMWWTNQAAQKRLLGILTEETDTIERKRVKKTLKPVYGLGVIFYLNSIGRVVGVMTWGLAYASPNGKLNHNLVNSMQTIIKTNGGFRKVESEVERIRMQKYLETEAKKLVASSISGSSNEDEGKLHKLDGRLESFPRPLHRYSESRPLNMRIAGVLRRSGGHGHGLLGQDQFARYENDDMQDLPPSYPQGLEESRAKSIHQWNLWEQLERRWEENEATARPSKEDPLWIRKGDETRNISDKERMAAAFKKHFTVNDN